MTEKVAYSLDEVCELISLGKTTVEGLIRTGKLRSVKIGGRRLVTRQQIDEFFASLTDRAEEGHAGPGRESGLDPDSAGSTLPG